MKKMKKITNCFKFMTDERFSFLDLLISNLILGTIFLITTIVMLAVNDDLAKQVDYYKNMYHEKDGAVRLLQERCGVK